MKLPGVPDIDDKLEQFNERLDRICVAVEKLVEIEEGRSH